MAVVNNRRLLLRIFIKILADSMADVLLGDSRHAVMLYTAVFLQRFAGVEVVTALITTDGLAIRAIFAHSLKKKIIISNKTSNII